MLPKNEVILMREERDCHIPVIAMTTSNTYETAAKALSHRKLGGLESPIFSNPWNLYRALIKLGYWKRNINWGMLQSGDFVPNKTVILVKDSKLAQHWILSGGLQHQAQGEPLHIVYWGDSSQPRHIKESRFKEMFLSHWPNCAFEVYKASVWRLVWERFKSLFKGGLT